MIITTDAYSLTYHAHQQWKELRGEAEGVIIMKFILKGKEFLSKKLEQLEIIADNMDVVNEQIPSRLRGPLRVLQNTQIDLESNDKYESYFRSYPNHHISHYLLEKYHMALNANLPPPQYALPPEQREVFVPACEAEMERHGLLLKEVVDEYEEGWQKVEEPVVCLAVIHFHHKRGTEVEYRYPNNKVAEGLDNLMVHHAMPDSSHNKMEDYNFFNFEAEVKGRKRMLFGVSYFKQIKVTEEMKAKNSEITRSYLQKALAVVTTLPLFGYLKLRLASTTKLFFGDFTNFSLIDAAYKDLSNNLRESWPRLDMQQLYIGSDLKTIINLFGVSDFYQIWKAVLYQKRVVIFAHSSSSASSFIISLLTLFPGLSTFGIYSQPISRYMQGLREYALPLRTFSSDNFMAMSFHIQDFHQLTRFQKNDQGSFLIGTTNRLLKQTNDYGIEMLINLENCTVEKKKARVPWEPISKTEKMFLKELEEIVDAKKGMGYEGSEDRIRNRFHSFLKASLVGIMRANFSLREWSKQCREYEKKSKIQGERKREKVNEYEVMQEEGDDGPVRKRSEEFPPLIPTDVTGVPFPGLLMTRSFTYFLQFHNQNLPSALTGMSLPSLLIDNYEYTLRLGEEEFVAYNWHDNRVTCGRGFPGKFQGKEIRFLQNEPLVVKHIYIGLIQGHKYSRSGFYLDGNQVFEGEYQQGVRQGYGKLTNSHHKYIGNFEHNLYEGEGQLVTGKEIYVGQFREGMKHGTGKNQGGELNYDGEWVNGHPEGTGVLKEGEVELLGRFKKGVLDEEQEVTIRYEDGGMFKGEVHGGKPNGKGYLIRDQKTVYGQFKEGELVRELTSPIDPKEEETETESRTSEQGVKKTEEKEKDKDKTEGKVQQV